MLKSLHNFYPLKIRNASISDLNYFLVGNEKNVRRFSFDEHKITKKSMKTG